MPAPIKEVPLQKSKTENIKLINCDGDGDFDWEIQTKLAIGEPVMYYFVVDNAL